MRLAIVDANAFWTEQLFRQCGRFADVLLLKPRDFRAHRAHSGTIRSDRAPRSVADRVWEQRLSLPPGWMVELWPWSESRLLRALRAFAGDAPLTLVTTYPQYRSLIATLKPALSIYYNLDDYRDNWPRHRARVPGWEGELVEQADLTVCIADHRVKLLRKKHPAKAGCIHHLPLGCTPEFLARRIRTETAARGFPPPLCAGYVGALNFRFDFAFVADVAERSPDVTFLLGGSVQEDGDPAWYAGLERARQQRNVKFIGWVDHKKLGERLAEFDVLLMPYTHCNFNTNACPAKLWDYLGAGKPIVANDANPETLLWREVVRIGPTPEAFAAALREAGAEQDGAMRQRRLEIAHAHTWEQLSHRLETILSAAPGTQTPAATT